MSLDQGFVLLDDCNWQYLYLSFCTRHRKGEIEQICSGELAGSCLVDPTLQVSLGPELVTAHRMLFS